MRRIAETLPLGSAVVAAVLVLSASGIPLTVGAASPGMPTNVMATAGDSQAQVSWTAPANNGGSTITNYAIWAQPDPNTTVQGVMSETPDASTSITVTGLTNDVYYTFTVIAFNGAWGSWSGYSAWVLPSATAPPPPTCASDITALRKAADYWIGLHPATSIDSTWFNAIFVKGVIELYNLTGDAKYLTYATDWANHNNWSLPAGAPRYDSFESGQEYIDLWQIDPTHPARDIANIQMNINQERARIEGGNTGDWSYVDSIRLAGMSAFIRLGVANNDPKQIADAMAAFATSKSHIYDSAHSLWWRDGGFVGGNLHWSRGNGWVVLALTDSIAALPAGDPNRATLIAVLQAMFAVMKANQNPAGYWTANVIPLAAYPASEETGTADFTYGMARGITMGYLDSATYVPVVQKAWNWLKTSSLQPSGLVGWVQGPANQPSSHQPLHATDTTNFGVGGFLFAGVRQARLNGC